MYKLNFLTKENDLNKIIRSYKRDRSPINILFVSLWDKHSNVLVSKLRERYKDTDNGQPLYVVDSFRMPHSFVIYNTTKLPHLVRLTKKGIQSDDYLSMIMRTLKIK
tara:strand:- start:42500 stop:42820 length:321 start_codon:yes stop_codon:yes gene_type:complete